MRWRLAVAGGNGKKSGETEQRERGEESRDVRRHDSGRDGMPPMTNAVAYQPHQNGGQGGNGGGQMMAYSGMTAGDYGPQNNGNQGGYSMFMPGQVPQNREMGFLAPMPDWEDRSGRGNGARSEEYSPDSGDVEARRRRSRRTGRFIRGEGDDGPEMRHHGRDEDEGDSGSRRGAYSRREHEDGGETEALRRKIRHLKSRLEEAEDAEEQVHALKREIRRLKSRLEEKDGGEERGKSEKHDKKARGNDEDEEDEPFLAGLKKLLREGIDGKQFLKHLPEIFQATLGVIASPPATWPPYLEKGDYSGIYAMEAKELMKAIEQYKTGQKGLSDVLREMKHTGAALIQMYAHLLDRLNKDET